MKKRIKTLFSVITFILISSSIYTYNHDHYKKAKAGERFFSILDLSFTDLSYAKLNKRDFSNANFWFANLVGTNLTKANLSYAFLKSCWLDGAIVKNANFLQAKGLSNKQKQYLREHGAINVPQDEEEKPVYLIILFQKVFNITKNQSKKLYHWLRKKDLSGKNLENQNLTKRYLIGALLNQANLKNADLSNRNLKDIKLENAIVEGANFAHTKNLTNEQKRYLREHGALNVPVEIIYELED